MGTCCVVQGTQLGALWWPIWKGWAGVGGGRETQVGGEIYIYTYIYTHTPIADSIHCTAETNTTL